MKWRHWAILIVLVLLNYIIFSTAFTQLAEIRRPKPRFTRTPYPTFERIDPSPVAWIVLPTSTSRPTQEPVTPQPTPANTSTVEITATVQVTVTVENQATAVVATQAPTHTPVPATVAPSDTPKPPTPTPSGDYVVHRIKSGETLSEIAAQYGVTVQAIVEANSLTNPSHIVTGQDLIIPLGGPLPPTPTTRPSKTPAAQPSNTPKPQVPTPKPTQKPPTTTPTKAAAGSQFTAEVIWDPVVAPNCSGPAISKQSIIKDTGGNPVNGARVEVDCYGNTWLSHASGTPGEYDPGHYDFSFGQSSPQNWTCTARVADLNDQPVDSEVITIQFDTNDCKPDGNGHQVAIVNWTKHW